MSVSGIQANTANFVHSFSFLDRNVSGPTKPNFSTQVFNINKRRLSLNPKEKLIKMEYDMNTSTKKTFTINDDGLGWTDGTTTHLTPLDRVSQISKLLPAVRPQSSVNSQVLAVDNTLLVLDDITTATCAINIQADNTGNVGTHFGIDIVNTSNNNDFEIRNDPSYEGSVVFKDFGAGSGTTQTGIKQGTISLTDTATPLTTSFSPTTLTSGVSSRTWADVISNTGSGNTLNQVLLNGNTATGSTALINLTNTGLGHTANPQLVLNNSNASVGNTSGVPSVEYYKSGRNVVANDVIQQDLYYAKNYLGTKTLFGKTECVVTSSSLGGGDDGALDFYTCVNGTPSLVMRLNGADNENNTFRPLDLNGNNMRTSSGDMTITTVGSSGSGNLAVSAKGFNNLGSSDSISLITSAGSGTGNINLTPRSGGALVAVNGIMKQEWISGSDTGTILYENDVASLNSAINMNYQSPSGNMQTNIQNIPSIQRILQSDGVLNRSAEYSPTKIVLTGDGGARTFNLENKVNATDNRLYLFNNQGGGIYTSSGIINANTASQLFLTYNDNANTKSTTITTADNTTSSIVHSNTVDANSFDITTNTDLNLISTKAGGSTQVGSLNGVEIRGDSSVVLNATNNSGGSITLSCNSTGDLNINGANLESSSSGGNSGQHLRIKLNGTYYKIQLQND